MNYYFIVNPVSGCGHGQKVWELIEQELKHLKITYKAFVLKYRGEARTLASGFAKAGHPITLIVVGGDGTLNEVIDGLSVCEHITLGCIPTGSGNDFVRGLGLEKSPIEALHKILNPKETQSIKIGTLSAGDKKTSFIVSSGIGFDAAVCHGANKSGLKTFLNWFHAGKLIYVFIALQQLVCSKLGTMKLTLDDNENIFYEQAYFAATMNLPYEGGGFKFAPNADPDGNEFRICTAEGISRLRVLSILPLAFSGNHIGKPGIHLLTCKKAVIQTENPLCVHMDGEVLGFFDTVTLEVSPTRITVITK